MRTRKSRSSRVSRRRPRGAVAILAGASVLIEVLGTWLRSGRLGGDVVVRCVRGHLFTTLWIPAVSVKSLRLGWWRLQRCPVANHWTIVTPVNESSLTDEERRAASEHRDVKLP